MGKRIALLPLFDPNVSDTDSVKTQLIKGLPVLRLDSCHRLHQRKLSLFRTKAGLSYSPSKKREQPVMLFVDIVDVYKKNKSSKSYRKAGISSSKQVIVNIRNGKGELWRFVFKDSRECDAFLNVVGMIYEMRRLLELSNHFVSSVRSLWERADHNQDGRLSLEEAKRLFARLNCDSIVTKRMCEVFEQCDFSGDGCLDPEEFTEFYKILIHIPELQSTFNTYAKSGVKNGMTLSEFQSFLKYQGDPVTLGREFFSSLGLTDKDRLSFFFFQVFLFHIEKNNVLHPRAEKVVDDMDRLLPNYFIDSSHNTYLSGDQFLSSSSVTMYQWSLRSGCRCIEIDCWDGKNGVPRVRHGPAGTTTVRFEDVIESINEHAFTVSEFPLIVSLEVRTSPSQSQRMAEILKRVLGSKLVMADEVKKVKYTPNGLRRRIIVKWKMPNIQVDSTSENDNEPTNERVPSSECEELRRCIAMGSHKTSNGGIDAEYYNVQSYPEHKMNLLIQNPKEQVKLQNTRMLSRVYPGGGWKSSNFDPMVPWASGCQLVALNFQTWDKPQRINYGMFTDNGRAGYVLKPSFLIDPQGGDKPTAYTLDVKVICGTQIPRPKLRTAGNVVDPYVKLEIHSATKQKSVQTREVQDNGLKPVWNESFQLQGDSVELDIITINVIDYNSGKNEEICGASIPLRLLRNGYRVVRMELCSSGETLHSARVLCHFKLIPVSNTR